MDPTTIIVVVVISALIFDFMNGWNDSANAIATVVSTRVMSPTAAVVWCAFLNFLGALVSTKVAKTIGAGVVTLEPTLDSSLAVLSAMIAASAWVGWCTKLGMPISGSHSLIGGLVGGSVGLYGFGVIQWAGITKILVALLVSPMLGLLVGFILIVGIYSSAVGFGSGSVRGWFLTILIILIGVITTGGIVLYSVDVLSWSHIKAGLKWAMSSTFVLFVVPILLIAVISLYFYKGMSQSRARKWFGALQICSSSFMAFQHGKNDAQKVMGVIALALFVGGMLPGVSNIKDIYIPLWVMFACGGAIAFGTAAGGWKVIRTLGSKLAHITPADGFAAEISAGIVLESAAELGVPVSTTHTITGSIIGVGTAKRSRGVKWGLGAKIIYAWILTLPVTFLLAAAASMIATKIGVILLIVGVLLITGLVIFKKK
ncbi:MAG: inorganic phosphate transporter [Planctomycetes bacterium]|nr:inorganic phosphate transporter [Planctomycetota bacterium]